MGEIIVKMELENYLDRTLFEEKKLEFSDVRKWQMDGLVDTGSTMLMLPQEVVEILGLRTIRNAIVTYADERSETRKVAGGLYIKIGERGMNAECMVGQPKSEALIGQIIMESLDLIVDPKNRKLSPRPESPIYPSLKAK